MFKNKTNNQTDSNDNDIFFSFKTLRSNEEIKKELAEEDTPINLYHKNMPKRLDRKKNRGLKIFLGGIFILIVATFVFYYFGKSVFDENRFFSGDNIQLEIKNKLEIASGEEFTYTIKYQNQENVDLSGAILTLNYPSGFVFKKAKPLPTSSDNSWDLGYLRSEGGGEIEVVGNFISEQDDVKKISARLKYSLGGEKSEGFKNSESEIKISSTVLALDITGPEQLLGQEGKYVVKISNNSDQPIENIKLMLTYPQDFVFKEASPFQPQENSDNEVWLINNIDGKDSKKIEISGSFKIAEDGVSSSAEKKFLAQVGILDAKDIFYLQQEKEFVTKLAQGDILVNLELNNSAENGIVGLDNFLNYAVKYSNKTKSELIGVKIKLLINSNVLDWTTLEDENSGVMVDEEIIDGMLARSITWTKEKIGPETDGVYNLKIKNKKYSQLDKTNSLNLKTQAKVSMSIEQIDTEKVDNLIQGNIIISQVNTELKLQTEAKLQNDNEYEVIWQLTNSIHEVENVKIEAMLGENIVWQAGSSVTAGDIYFDKEAQSVSWQLNRIPVGVDIPLTAKFKLKTSTESRPILLNNLNLSAVDKVTGAVIKQTFSQVMGY
jgi:hypothetical protein